MKKTFFLLLFCLFCMFPLSVFAIDFKINSYQGDLYIHADNTAEFRQKIVYQFEEDFKGQIVGLGRAGKMPSGFEIDPQPKVQASKNGAELTDVTSEVTEEANGYTVKVYNSGQDLLLRTRAEIDNMRRRSEQDIEKHINLRSKNSQRHLNTI